jgi:hypothetical protein
MQLYVHVASPPSSGTQPGVPLLAVLQVPVQLPQLVVVTVEVSQPLRFGPAESWSQSPK